MAYVELYSNDILDTINVGKITSEFNENNGDYIKVEVFPENSDTVLNTFFSNRVLLKYSDADEYYIEEYHFHPENLDMGFCTGRQHTNGSITNLQPIPVGNSLDEPLNSDTNYKKQFDIFNDDSGEIYIKPNEIIKLTSLNEGKFKIRIHFLRNIKSTLGNFLSLNKNNLIENGNFFAGLEATQTGDLDRSTGRNNFIVMMNPGYSKFVLEQDGIGNNIYNMRVTGIRPNTYYIFSCWVAWGNNFGGSDSIVRFDKASNLFGEGLPTQDNTTPAGSTVVTEDPNYVKELSSKVINEITWYKLFSKVFTNEKANLGSIDIKLGSLINESSNTATGRRYYTDLRFEEVENFENALLDHINKLKMENE